MTIKAQIGPGRPCPEPAIYVALRVSAISAPYLPSERMSCACCAVEVWVDPMHYAPLKLREHALRVLCVECADELARRRRTAAGEEEGLDG